MPSFLFSCSCFLRNLFRRRKKEPGDPVPTRYLILRKRNWAWWHSASSVEHTEFCSRGMKYMFHEIRNPAVRRCAIRISAKPFKGSRPLTVHPSIFGPYVRRRSIIPRQYVSVTREQIKLAYKVWRDARGRQGQAIVHIGLILPPKRNK